MIVPMTRVQIAGRRADRERILEVLGGLAAVHVVPANPATAVPEEQTAAAASRVAQARQILRGVKPGGERPELGAAAAADEVLALRRRGSECQARLAVLHRQAAQLELWGEVRAERVAGLEAAGLVVGLLSIPANEAHLVEGEVVDVVARPTQREALVLVAGAPERVVIPAGARPIPPPERGRSALLAEAAELERALERDQARLSELAHLRPELDTLHVRLEGEVRWSVARRGLLEAGPLCGLEGWVAEDRTAELERALEQAGLPAAVRSTAAAAGERPPTLVRYPRWAEPIRGLLDMLGTVPGYSELDLGGFFMIALPIFAGMIIADAGYGLIFLLVPLLFAGRSAALLGEQRRRLLLSFGVTATAWGALTGVWFGFVPTQMLEAGGVAGLLGDLLYPLQRIRGTEAETRAVVTKICMLIGSTHLIAGHLRRALALAPSQRALAEIGWCIVLTAMGGLIWILLFGAEGRLPGWLADVVVGGLATGTALVVLFMAPDPNPLRRVGLGLAGTVLPLIGTFADTLSYIRLMAVGLAGSQIGGAFDTMALSVMDMGAWAILPGILVLVGGHLLNMGLVLIAIVAHGVRLNMLEFSSHAGVQWTGYAFRPLAMSHAKEI
jgi:V/A-type H+/Na+-transporting ATPase subunit I